MDQQLKALFQKCEVKYDPHVWEKVVIKNIVYNKQKDFWKVKLMCQQVLPPAELDTINKQLKNQLDFKCKIHYVINFSALKPRHVLSYLNYAFHLVDEKYNFMQGLTLSDVGLKNKNIFITCHSVSQYKHLPLMLKKHQAWFAQLGWDINVFRLIKDIAPVEPSKEPQQDEVTLSQPLKNTNHHHKIFTNDDALYPPLNQIKAPKNYLKIKGKVFKLNKFFAKSKIWIIDFYINDHQGSFQVKYFYYQPVLPASIDKIKVKDWIEAQGEVVYENNTKPQLDNELYTKNLIMKAKSISLCSPPALVDPDPVSRSELHIHTKMSIMDSVGDIADYFSYADQLNLTALGFVDLGNVQAFPIIENINQQYPHIKAIYGTEINVVNDQIDYLCTPAQGMLLSEAKYVFFDLETTGLNPEQEEIIEFGAVVTNNGPYVIKESINILIKPTKAIASRITQLTAISAQTFIENESFSIREVWPKIRAIIKDAILVAHNAKFDWNFLQVVNQKLGYPPLNNVVLDTVTIARALIQSRNYRLGTLAKKLDVTYEALNAHRALYDADVLWKVFLFLYEKMQNLFQIQTDQDINKIHDPALILKQRPFHVTVLAKNQAGLKALYRLITEASTTFFYRNPRVTWAYLNKHRQNLFIGSACYNNELWDLLEARPLHEVKAHLKNYDFIEIQPPLAYMHWLWMKDLSASEIKNRIIRLIQIAQTEKKLIVATGDVHYLYNNDFLARNVYINSKRIGGIAHPLMVWSKTDHEANHNYHQPKNHLRSTKEMLAEFSFLKDQALIQKIVIDNTNQIAQQITKVTIQKNKMYTPSIPKVDQTLTTLCMEQAHRFYGATLPAQVAKRIDHELAIIKKHHFSFIYWLACEMVQDSLRNGFLVGSRGSVGSSLVATMVGITEVNPLAPHYLCLKCHYHTFDVPAQYKSGYDLPQKKCPNCDHFLKGEGQNIPFATFLGFDGDKVPDIDLNFSHLYQKKAHNYLRELLKGNAILRAGTINTVAFKTALGYVKAYLQKIRHHIYISSAEEARLITLCQGSKRTTGQHPGGLILIPQGYDVEEFTPTNFPADDPSSDWKTTHFEFNYLHDNLLKIDALGHVDPSMLYFLKLWTKKDPLDIPTNDQKVLSLFRSCEALNIAPQEINHETTGATGLPEFGTMFVKRMLKQTKPYSFSDLVQISGLSHGTNVWTSNAEVLIKNQKATLAQVIGCRDDIMTYLIEHKLEPIYAFNIMEAVRKGKGLTSQDIAIMKKNAVPAWYIDSCQKITYLFPKAHAVAYTLMAYRIAWFKLYYPEYYYAAFFTTRLDVFDLTTALEDGETIAAKLKDFNQRYYNKTLPKNKLLTAKEIKLWPVYEVLLELKARKIEFKTISILESAATVYQVKKDPTTKKLYILPPFIAVDGLGEVIAHNIVKARAIKPFSSIEELCARTKLSKTHLSILKASHSLDALASRQINLF